MGAKVDTIKLPEEYDRRRKLSNRDYEKIRKMYATGNWSYRALGREFGVDKNTIAKIVDERVSQYIKEQAKKNWRKYQQTVKEHSEATRKTREYKRNLLKEGKI